VAAINLILPDQLAELRVIEGALTAAADRRAAMTALADSVASVLDVAVVVIERSRGEWIFAGHSTAPGAETLGRAWEERLAAHGRDAAVIDVAIPDHGVWTCATLVSGKPVVLLIQGDWTLSGKLLADIASGWGAAIGRSRSRSLPAPTGLSTTYALARRLTQMSDPIHIQQMIVRTAARIVDAEKASLALYSPNERTLAITATHGYPPVVVRHLRIAPGVGVIGSVFLRKLPVVVQNAAKGQAGRARLRYRTTSFVAVPLLGVAGAIGVLSVTDKRGGEPFHRNDLSLVRGMSGVAALALERVSAAQRADSMAQEAAIDPLTGLFNRRHFLARLEEEAERARRQGAPLTAMMLDVDGFKQVNDRLGHAAGDSVLRAIGDILRRSVRIFDVCARLGGDEFAVLMPGSSAESSAHIAERIREDLEGSRPATGPWPEGMHVTASVGIATALNAVKAEELMARADQALYAAKRQGKNCVRSA